MRNQELKLYRKTVEKGARERTVIYKGKLLFG